MKPNLKTGRIRKAIRVGNLYMYIMKKIFYLISLALIFLSGSVYSQSTATISKTQLNLGVGFSGWGIPIYVGLDYYVHPDISIGGELSYRSYNEKWNSKDYSHNVIGILGNANYHFNRVLNISTKWDFYAGLNVGFYIWNSPDEYYGNNNSGLGLGAQIGGRYYLSDKIGLNLEFGGGNAFSDGKFGVTFQL